MSCIDIFRYNYCFNNRIIYMIMKEEFVTLETSKLLKKKGFNEFCKYAYADEDLHLMPLNTTNFFIDEIGVGYSAPTQSIAHRWLREVKDLYVCIFNSASGYGYEISKVNGTHMLSSGFEGPNDDGNWNTYEEALEAGIQRTLELI